MGKTQPAYPTGLDFEQVWAALMETRAVMEETNREVARRQEEVARRQEETDRQMKETGKRIGELTGRFGEIVEYMIVPNLVTKFRELGFTVTRANRDVKIVDDEHGIHAEVDAFLENGDKVMIVEIKSKPNTDDVNDHIARMEKLRAYANLKNDNRKYLGAIAGVVISESVITYALKNGLYVIEPSGETFNIIEPTGKYHPREW
jgi:hypothetical protein